MPPVPVPPVDDTVFMLPSMRALPSDSATSSAPPSTSDTPSAGSSPVNSVSVASPLSSGCPRVPATPMWPASLPRGRTRSGENSSIQNRRELWKYRSPFNGANASHPVLKVAST